MPEIRVKREPIIAPYWSLGNYFLRFDESQTLSSAQITQVLDNAGAYGPSNILGTVSQSGGTPTGALIERGSNANGRYAKFADGTLMCWVSDLSLSFISTSQLGASITFPHAFFDTEYATAPEATSFITTDTAARGNIWFPTSRTSTGYTARFVSDGHFQAGDSAVVNLMISGRWF